MDFATPEYKSTVTINPKVNREEQQPVFWFQREDGPFCVSEKEAWDILRGRIRVLENGEVKSRRFSYLGRSSGQIYFAGLKEMNKIFAEQGKEKAQEFLRELQRKEAETADRNVMPRNYDFVHLNTGQPTSLERMKLGYDR